MFDEKNFSSFQQPPQASEEKPESGAERNEDLEATAEWYKNFKGEKGNYSESPYAKADKKLEDFLYNEKGHNILFSLDQAIEEAITSGNVEAAKKVQTILQRIYEEAERDNPDLDNLAEVIMSYVEERLNEIRKNAEERYKQIFVRANEKEPDEYDIKRFLERFDEWLDQIRQAEEYKGKNPPSKTEILWHALEQVENVRQAGGGNPEFDVFSYKA